MSTLAEHISLNQVTDHYVSTHHPQRMTNPAPVAYGGYSIALAIHAAYKSLPGDFHLYSAVGHYLRPVSTAARLIIKPRLLRHTRNFITYRIAIEQETPDSTQPRECLEILADFHHDEPSLLSYSAPPTRPYSHWKDCPPWTAVLDDQWVKPGRMPSPEARTFNTVFGLPRHLYEGRLCPEGIMAQNLYGMVKHADTSQDQLPPTAKTSADWLRVLHPLSTEGEEMGALGLVMDSFLSILALTHNHMFFDDTGAVASLDFALRVFQADVRMEEWHLRELVNHEAGRGRTYSESRLWDEKGGLVACMTQQSILRVPNVKGERAKI
ncbi:acyl-CoA thioesterase II [Aspergillus heteromorphus CBS 117.55]|uniref:Acyl-CoA thioesterase II n=1 Tax=Aspergillus heteromorphus CBS 117.55 TaxID=1448321 RepID=A0A317VDE2_9EURO|nr:acyl-CoA thioesterase II [Aspergillus heteromorphus CBS 117.55]PWY71028.1 acyl-CoA thioesterase II [Aspergillus heteromorphus CBS 117.55]